VPNTGRFEWHFDVAVRVCFFLEEGGKLRFETFKTYALFDVLFKPIDTYMLC